MLQIEEAIREGEENFRDIFETVSEGIAYTTLAGKVLSINKSLEIIIGIPRENIVGNNIITLASDLLSGPNRTKALPLLKSIIVGRNIEPFQVDYKDKVLEISVNINKKTKRLTGTIRDITGAKKTTIALEKSENRLNRAEISSKSGNWELHLDTGKIVGSEGAMKLYGVSDFTVDYEVIKKIPLPEYRPMMDEAIKELISNGKPYDIEFKIKNNKTGEIIDIRSISDFDRENRIVFGVMQDITDRKRAEEEIRNKGRDFAKLLEITMDLLETVDRRKVFEKIVKGAPGLIGLESGAIYLVNGNDLYLEATNPPLAENMPDELRKASLENHPHINRAILNREPVVVRDTMLETFTPEEKLIADVRNLRSIIYIPLVAEKEAVGVIIFGTIGFQHDFTPHEHDMCRTLSNITSLALENSILIRNLVSAKEKAEESDRLKTSFLHNISHEIRTPLNAIIGFSGFLDQPDLTEEDKKTYIDIIFQSNNQLLSIINDILNISHIETGQVVLKMATVNINITLTSLHRQFLPEAQKKNIEFRFNVGLEDDQAVIETDEAKLIQVLSNLISNALKFTDRGLIEFGYEYRDDQIVFSVADSGIGISEEEQSRIFDRFYQVDKTISRTYGGTGLGLSISKGYVEMLGGMIWVKSNPGSGSRFFFSIPAKSSLKSGKSKVISTYVLKPEQKHANAKSILVAEDEDSNFALVLAMLKNQSLNILRANNGKEAVEIFKNNMDLGLILMDIKMPVMDGLEATVEILKLNPDVPIIAQTAYVHPADRQKALESGCKAYLSKPFGKKELIETINQYLQ
jgi:PAS domain S-box-containing protein